MLLNPCLEFGLGSGLRLIWVEVKQHVLFQIVTEPQGPPGVCNGTVHLRFESIFASAGIFDSRLGNLTGVWWALLRRESP